MKKILALALALLMMATTVSLAACSKDEPAPDDDEDEYEYNYNDDTDEDTSEDTEKDTDDDDKDDVKDDEENLKGDWIEKNDKVCVGMNNVVLREGPGTDYSKITLLNAGKVLNRTGTNGKWHKVLYNDEECYIKSDFVSLDMDDFDFVAYSESEQKQLNVIGDYKINLRTTPFYNEDYTEDNLGLGGFSAVDTDEDDESLKLLAKSKSGDWYKVSFTGTWGSKSYENEVFYLAASSAKYVNGLDGASSSDNGSNQLG